MVSKPKRGEAREIIIAEAMRLFAQKGFYGVSLRDISEASGVGVSAINRHFPLKQHLQEEVLGRAVDALHARVKESLVEHGAPKERLERLIRNTVDWVLSDSPEMRVIDWELQSLDNPAFVESLARVLGDRSAVAGAIAELFEETQSDFLKTMKPQRLSDILFAIIYGVSKLRALHALGKNGKRLTKAAIADEVFVMVWKILN